MRTAIFRIIGLFLIATSIAKITSAFSGVKILPTDDPLIAWLTVRQILLLGAGLELVAAIILFSRRFGQHHPWITSWLALIFVGYRFALWSTGYTGACPCLGTVTDWLPQRGVWLDPIMRSSLLLMLGAGLSYWCLDKVQRTYSKCRP